LTDHALITIRDASSPTFSVMRQRMSAQANQPKSRLPNSPLDLCLRMLNTMIDKYLELRTPNNCSTKIWDYKN
jgi:Mg2+ and Co2+ transporter CorA